MFFSEISEGDNHVFHPTASPVAASGPVVAVPCDRRKDSAALRYVDETLRGDRDFVLGALQRNAEAVDFAGF